MKFTDTLHVIVTNGEDKEVALKVKGVGSTLFCRELNEFKSITEDSKDVKQVDFGTEYTYKNVFKEFFLENRGRKPMKIIWARQSKKEKKKPAEIKDGKNDSKTNTSAVKEPEEPQVFTVTPAEIMLNQKMGIKVEVRANSEKIGKILEQW